MQETHQKLSTLIQSLTAQPEIDSHLMETTLQEYHVGEMLQGYHEQISTLINKYDAQWDKLTQKLTELLSEQSKPA